MNPAGTAKLPAVFLDRDGVISQERSHITRPQDLVLLAGAADAIARLNRSRYRVVVVTNQSIVARGGCSETGLAAIHEHLRSLLRQGGALLDAIYYCPHHPDPGAGGEPALAIMCDCRKPRAGLVRRAADELGIALAGSWMVGDSSSDIAMAHAAGLRSILVRTGYGGSDGRHSCEPDFVAADLAGAAGIILDAGTVAGPA